MKFQIFIFFIQFINFNKNFIVLRKNGILEAESAQIFNFGLNDGTAINTGGVRKDANDAILFESGVVLLDDDKYNNEYLNDANLAVKLADDGTLNVTCNFGSNMGKTYTVVNSNESNYEEKRERFSRFLSSIPGSIYRNNNG